MSLIKFWNNYPGPTLLDYIKSLVWGSSTAIDTPPYTISTIQTDPPYNNSIHQLNGEEYIYTIIPNCIIPNDIRSAWMTDFKLYDIHLEPGTIILTLRSRSTGRIAATIAAKPFGHIRRNYLQLPMHSHLHYIDYFWTDKALRGNGLGNFMLNAIRHSLSSINGGSSPVIFLKEGTPLSKWIPPLYSSVYIYKQFTGVGAARQYTVQFISQNTAQQFAAKWLGNSIDSLQQVQVQIQEQRQDTYYILWNNQIIYYITIPGQYGPDGRSKIAWITGMISSPRCRDYSVALDQTGEFIAYSCETRYIWADINFLKNNISQSGWLADGPFHIYAYDWNPIVFGTPINGFFN